MALRNKKKLPANVARGRQTTRIVVRVLISSALFIIAGVALFYAAKAARRHFYVENPHFTLLHVNANPTTNYSRDRVLTILSEMGVDIGHCNLLVIDLAAIRQRLLAEPLIHAVELRRIIPDTLDLQLSESMPEATLRCIPTLLIDRHGFVLPYQGVKGVPATLPQITGIRNPAKLSPGTRTDDFMLLGALRLLRYVATHDDMAYCDIALIQLDYSQRSFRLILRATPGGSIFRAGSEIIVPYAKMNEAFKRLNEIVVMKRERGGSIGSIDVSYERNIPLTP
jgi:hypothetical protein